MYILCLKTNDRFVRLPLQSHTAEFWMYQKAKDESHGLCGVSRDQRWLSDSGPWRNQAKLD